MLSQMTAEQLDEWIAANELDQLIGLEKLYAMLSLIATALVNSWGGEATPEMFIPQYETPQAKSEQEESELQTPNQMAALLRMYAADKCWKVT